MIYQTVRRGLGQLRRWIGNPPYAGLPWLIGLYVVTCCLIYTDNGPFTGHLIGFDDKVRMTQVLNLVNGAGWYDRTLTRVDPPVGFESIWARIVDIPLALVVIIGQIFVDQKTAALAATVIVTLAELGVLFFVARYAARPLVGKKDSWLVVLFLMFSTLLNQKHYTFSGFHLGEASHHSWYIILYTLMIGSGARIAMGVKGKKTLFLMSLSIALFLAVGIEGFPLIAGSAAVIGLTAWIFNQPKMVMQGAIAVTGGALLGLLLLPMHEPLSHLSDISFAQPSILGPILVGAAAVCLALESLILKYLGKSKIVSAILTIIVACGIGWLLIAMFPQMLNGPAAALSPQERVLAATEHPESWAMYRATTDTTELIGLTAPSVIAVISALIAVFTTRNRRRRRMYVAYMGYAILGGAMAQIMWRYVHHAMTSACLWLTWTWQKLRHKLRRNVNYNLASLSIFIALGPFWMLLLPAVEDDLPFLSQVVLYPAKMYAARETCDALSMADYLNTHYDKSTRIDVPDWDSAAFLYYSDLTIDFLSNYPSQDRFIENKAFFQTQDMDQAATIAAKHNFDLVAICAYLPIAPETAASRRMREPMMMEMLAEGNPPRWMDQVYTGIQTHYRLYRVDKARLKNQIE